MNFYQPEKIRGMLIGMFIGDALAMPVHWYYDTKALQQDYGSIRDMQAPRSFILTPCYTFRILGVMDVASSTEVLLGM